MARISSGSAEQNDNDIHLRPKQKMMLLGIETGILNSTNDPA